MYESCSHAANAASSCSCRRVWGLLIWVETALLVLARPAADTATLAFRSPTGCQDSTVVSMEALWKELYLPSGRPRSWASTPGNCRQGVGRVVLLTSPELRSWGWRSSPITRTGFLVATSTFSLLFFRSSARAAVSLGNSNWIVFHSTVLIGQPFELLVLLT